uniref:Uncharacterized protein n=1 Tax=viral metagenome TaxID=1070528 RepID=A0A6C0CTI1_9ZZZZ
MNENKLKRLHNHYVNDVKDKRSSILDVINDKMNDTQLTQKDQVDFLLKAMPFIYKYGEQCKKGKILNHDTITQNNPNQDEYDYKHDNNNDYVEDIDPMVYNSESDSDVDTNDSDSQQLITQNIEHYVNRTSILKRGKLYKEFMKECMDVWEEDEEDELVNAGTDEPYNVIADTTTNNARVTNFECAACKTNTMLYIINESLLVCTTCGLSDFYQDFSLMSYTSLTNNGEIITQFAYKRINHFREWLTQIQAKENTIIPKNIIVQIMKELKKERVVERKDITPDKIKRYLKKNGMSKYYEHIPTIICEICGRKNIQISYDIEQILIEKFKQIQEPFERHRPKNRKNFLSYSYTLHKLCQLIDRPDLLILFPLLKSRSKLYVQDTIWNNICHDLGWKFIPSI